jgi:hypothetical protein
MSKRWVLPASYLSDHGLHGDLWTLVITGCIFGLSSNQKCVHIVYHTVRNFLLHQDGLKAEKWGSYISEVCAHCLEKSDWKKRRSLHWWYSCEVEKARGLLDGLKETFDSLCKYKMMLNPKKYVFGVSSEKLLGYMVSSRGIDVNPTKVKPSKNYNHIGREEKSRSWHVWWQPSADSSPCWANVVCRSISCYARQINSIGMIKLQ